MKKKVKLNGITYNIIINNDISKKNERKTKKHKRNKNKIPEKNTKGYYNDPYQGITQPPISVFQRGLTLNDEYQRLKNDEQEYKNIQMRDFNVNSNNMNSNNSNVGNRQNTQINNVFNNALSSSILDLQKRVFNGFDLNDSNGIGSFNSGEMISQNNLEPDPMDIKLIEPEQPQKDFSFLSASYQKTDNEPVDITKESDYNKRTFVNPNVSTNSNVSILKTIPVKSGLIPNISNLKSSYLISNKNEIPIIKSKGDKKQIDKELEELQSQSKVTKELSKQSKPTKEIEEPPKKIIVEEPSKKKVIISPNENTEKNRKQWRQQYVLTFGANHDYENDEIYTSGNIPKMKAFIKAKELK